MQSLFLYKGWGPNETMNLYLDDRFDGIWFYYNTFLRATKKK